MPERVTFTRKSADRIASAVKHVENVPAAEPIQQRRRAGGYRMESLWEVTEVQTEEKTVTLKRVQDTDDNLNDRSETFDVAYDPNNEPAIGDRGMIIRLGHGTRFFFSRISPLFVTKSACYVDENAPSSNFGSLNDWDILISDGSIGSQHLITVGKFPTVGSGNYDHFHLGRVIPTIILQTNGTQTFLSGNFFDLKFYKITEDFDTTTLTYNDWVGLEKSSVEIQTIYGNMAVGSQPVNRFATTLHANITATIGLFATIFGNGALDLDGAYGWAVDPLSNGVADKANLWRLRSGSSGIRIPYAVKTFPEITP